MEFTNICPHCGAENTIWPVWLGRKRAYKCENCNKFTRGVTKAAYEKKHMPVEEFVSRKRRV